MPSKKLLPSARPAPRTSVANGAEPLRLEKPLTDRDYIVTYQAKGKVGPMACCPRCGLFMTLAVVRGSKRPRKSTTATNAKNL